MSEKLSISQWAEEDKPREKLERLGASALSNAELLAILIGSGSRDESAVDLMKRIMSNCDNNLNTLGKKTIRELTEYKGMGPAKAITIMAACELGKRRSVEKLGIRPEEAWVLMMNQNFKLIKAEPLSHGGITETAVDVRLIIKKALLNNATIIALCHNHPSNNPTPSKQDDQLTLNVKKACDVMRLFFMDHIIVTDGHYYSYHDKGRL